MHSRATERSTKKAKGDKGWEKARKRKGKSPAGSKGDGMSEIEQSIERKHWKKAHALVQEKLVSAPMDHWLWLTLSLTYYEQKEYEKALEASRRAVQLEPDCPLALWHFAGSLYMTGHESSALVVWTMLLDMDIEKVAYGEHGEGMDWALQLINDVHFRMGRYFHWKGQDQLAAESFKKYLHNRKHGVTSLYDAKKAEEYLAEVS